MRLVPIDTYFFAQADGVLATESDCGWCLGSKLQEALLGFQPNAFEPQTERKLPFRLFLLVALHPPIGCSS